MKCVCESIKNDEWTDEFVINKQGKNAKLQLLEAAIKT